MKTILVVSFVTFLGNALFAQFVTTIAGNSTATHLDGNGTSASFYHPHDVAVDNAGIIYVADQGNHVIRRIGTDGEVTTLAGSPGVSGNQDGQGSTARFSNPTGVLYYNNTLYVTDYSNHLIRSIDVATGMVSTLAGNGSQGNTDGAGPFAQLGGPTGICLFSSTEILFTEQLNNKVRILNLGTLQVTTYAGDVMGAPGSTDGPIATSKFNAPYDVFSSAGVIVVADQSNHKIRLIMGGNVSTFAGNGSAATMDGPVLNASFHTPLSLVGNESGELFVVDYGTAVIRKIDQTATVTSIVGSGYNYADGNFGSARFHSPTGMTMDNDGNLIIADYGNNRIRKVYFSGSVSLNENKPEMFDVYPNPAVDVLNVTISEATTVTIVTAMGARVATHELHSGQNNIDVSHLESGIYFIRAENGGTVKFIRE